MMQRIFACVLILVSSGLALAQPCPAHDISKVYSPTPGEDDLFGVEIIAQDDLLYVFDMNGPSMHTYSCTNGSVEFIATGLVGDVEFNEYVSVSIDGQFAAVLVQHQAGTNDAVLIFDISDPAQPVEVSRITSFVRTESGGGTNEVPLGGSLVEFSGNVLAVGVPGWGPYQTGAVHFYDLSNPTSPQFAVTVVTPGPYETRYSQFGLDISIEGDLAAIGAPYKAAASGYQEGAVYLYDVSGVDYSGSPAVGLIKVLRSSDSSRRDEFGTQVELDGDRLAVVALLEDTHGPDSGSIYVYDITDPENPVESEISYDPAGEVPKPYHARFYGNSLYAVAGRLSLDTAIQFELSSSEGPVEVVRYQAADDFEERSGNFSDLAICGGMLVAALKNSHVYHQNAGAIYAFDPEATAGCEGDANNDCTVDVNDLSYVLFRLDDPGPDGDANGDGIVDVNDISYVLFRLGNPC